MTARPDKPTHADIFEFLGRIESRFDEWDKRWGEENDEGNGGSGLIGRVARIEAKVANHDRLAAAIRGGFVATCALVLALWWVIKAKVAAALGVTP